LDIVAASLDVVTASLDVVAASLFCLLLTRLDPLDSYLSSVLKALCFERSGHPICLPVRLPQQHSIICHPQLVTGELSTVNNSSLVI